MFEVLQNGTKIMLVSVEFLLYCIGEPQHRRRRMKNQDFRWIPEKKDTAPLSKVEVFILGVFVFALYFFIFLTIFSGMWN